MEFPLISRELIAYLKLVHGSFNFFVVCLFVIHGRYGLQISKARRGKLPQPFVAMRRHRKFGPILAVLGGAGFCFGLTLTLLDTGKIWNYPPHLLVGSAILTLILWTYRVSRKITIGESHWRDVHYRLGIAIMSLYIVNIALGLGVLL